MASCNQYAMFSVLFEEHFSCNTDRDRQLSGMRDKHFLANGRIFLQGFLFLMLVCGDVGQQMRMSENGSTLGSKYSAKKLVHSQGTEKHVSS